MGVFFFSSFFSFLFQSLMSVHVLQIWRGRRSKCVTHASVYGRRTPCGLRATKLMQQPNLQDWTDGFPSCHAEDKTTETFFTAHMLETAGRRCN